MRPLITKAIIVVFIGFILNGCDAEYKDVSEGHDFIYYIKTSYVLTSDMDISGVNLPPGYSKEINVYIISSRDHSWSGPEVITRDILKKGTLITINKVYECTNCLTFGNKLRHAIVTIKNYKTEINVPIQLNLELIKSGKHVNKV